MPLFLRFAFIVALLLPCACAGATGAFDDRFTGETFRLDFSHTGHAELELIGVDRMRIEGPWPGSRTQMIDDSNLGKYRFEVIDEASSAVLYSRGFSSIFGEWETTGPAREGAVRTLAEALRFPEPRRPFSVALSKRNERMEFEEIWRTEVDPASRFVARPPAPEGDVLVVLDSGSPATKVDLLFLGDGYTAAERDDFQRDVQRLSDALFAEEPYRSRRSDFNVRAVFTPAAYSGVSNPRAGVFRDSPLGVSYNIFDSDRYALTLDDRAWRDHAACAPYDFCVMLINQEKYGGGGILQLYCTAAAGSAESEYLVVHEFGHHFAGLADEYFTSSVAYEEFTAPRVEPWEPNATALLDPARLKWGDLVEPGIALPTPWNREVFEVTSLEFQRRRKELRERQATEAELEALFEEERARMTELLAPHRGRVGAYEGAMYEAHGMYRPTVDCLMFSRNEVGFCPPCAGAIEGVIDQHSR